MNEQPATKDDLKQFEERLSAEIRANASKIDANAKKIDTRGISGGQVLQSNS